MLAKRASGQEKQRRILDIMFAKQAAGQEQQRRKPDIMLAECAAGQETTNTHTQTSHYAGEMRRGTRKDGSKSQFSSVLTIESHFVRKGRVAKLKTAIFLTFWQPNPISPVTVAF